MKNRILITGATGNTGMAVVERLAHMDIPFRAMVHTPAKMNLVKKGQAEIVAGDFNNAASLDRALAGIERVYLLSPPSPDQFTLQTGFVDRAKKKGVKHIVKLSALGTAHDSPVGLLRDHARIEEHIKGSGIAYTFLRPHFFMENLLMNAGTVLKDNALYSPLGEARISPISVQDIGAVAATVLTKDGHAGKVYTLTGRKAVSYAEIAWTLGDVLHRSVRYVPVLFDAARQGMVQAVEDQPARPLELETVDATSGCYGLVRCLWVIALSVRHATSQRPAACFARAGQGSSSSTRKALCLPD